MIGAKEIKVPFYCNPCARNQLEMFNAGITYLHSRAVLTVLNNGIVQIQFVLGGGYDIVSAKAGEVKLADDPQVPVVIGLINQRRLGKNGLEAELVAKQPDNAAAWCDGRVLISPQLKATTAKILSFVNGNETKTFPGISKASPLT